MDGLRWLLLLFGILVIAGVYAYSRREKKPVQKEAPSDRVEPVIQTSDVEHVSPQGEAEEDASGSEAGSEAGSESARAATPQKIVTLRLIGKNKNPFAGDELILSLRGIGMRHGKFGIFHRYDGSDENRTIFSAASLVEPGSFDLANIKDQQIPGISLFLVLPGPVDGVEAFDLMMATARALAQTMHGELLDESGSSLSIQRERYLREEIIQYQHSILVA